MAEWLRRWTRNPMGSPRAGSNPARSASFWSHYFSALKQYAVHKIQKSLTKNEARLHVIKHKGRLWHHCDFQ